jgi:signal peptidase I
LFDCGPGTITGKTVHLIIRQLLLPIYFEAKRDHIYMNESVDLSPPGQSAPPERIVNAALEIWSQTHKQQVIPISGQSMLPLIQNGDNVLVEHGTGSISRGDIIVFLQADKMVAHRVLRIKRQGASFTLTAKGDNNPYFDPPVEVKQVVGRVLKIKRGDEWISIDTPGWQFLGGFIAVSMLVWIRFYNWGRLIKGNLWGSQNNRLLQLLRRCALAVVSLPLNILRKMTYRPKN